MAEILTIEQLRVEFPRKGFRQPPFVAVDGVDLAIDAGETVALVGESGSGKSTIGRAVLGLTPAAAGRIRYRGEDITHRDRSQQRRLARSMQVIFQDPYSSLNPSKRIGELLLEPLRTDRSLSRSEALSRVEGLIRRVGLPEDTLERYPGRFSGGQRQRIAIARALSVQPDLIICDEPTSALDVSTQASVLTLLKELQDQFGLAYLFITHDLAVVRHFADRVAVLHNGQVVEEGDVVSVCTAAQHPYTQRLLAAAPVPDPVLQRERREARIRDGLTVDAEAVPVR